MEIVRGPWGVENRLRRTLDVWFREDDSAVMGILRQAVLNMVRTIQWTLETDVSIKLLRDRIEHRSWILASALP